jgi:hypothetical protein
MLSQDEVQHNSPMLLLKSPLFPRQAKLVSPFNAIWLFPASFQ